MTMKGPVSLPGPSSRPGREVPCRSGVDAARYRARAVTPPRRTIHLVPLSIVWALLLVATPAASAQQPDGGFVAEPVPGSQVAPAGGYFLLEAAPGDEVRQAVGLRNDSGEPLELRLDAVDAMTGQRGGASYELPEDEADRTGAWIRWERSTVTLAPGASAVVPFTVVVPAGVRSGDHLAGLSIAAPAKPGDEGERQQGQAGASVDVQTRHIIAVQIEVPGRADPELVITEVEPDARPDGLYLQIGIANRGRKLTKARGSITVGDRFEQEFDVDTFVPGTRISYPVKWTTQAEQGEYPASVELRYGDEVATFQGDVRVGDSTLAELGDRQVTVHDEDTGGSDPPVSLIAGVLLAAAVLIGGYGSFRRRRGGS